MPPWGWRGSWGEFASLNLKSFLRSLLLHIQNRWSDKPLNLGQVKSWIREHEIFQQIFKELVLHHPSTKEAIVCFEYELALEEGERPDILLHLPNGVTFIIECKNREFLNRQDFNQVRKYERSLKLFHSVQRASMVVLLLQSAKTQKADGNAEGVAVCDSSETGLKNLFKLVQGALESKPDSRQVAFSPTECYQPSATLVASVVSAVEDATSTAKIPEPKLNEAIAQVVNEAKKQSEHILIALPGEKSSGKTAFGLHVIASTWQKGIPAIYLTGDEPPTEDVAAFFKKIAKSVGPVEASCFIRGMSQFPRYTSRSPLDSPFRVFVFDNTQHCLFPPADNFPLHEVALIAHADKQPWAVILVLVDFEGGPFTNRRDLSVSVKHWFQRLLLHKNSSKWKLLSPQNFGVSSNAAEKHGISLFFDSKFYLGQRPLPCPQSESNIDPLQEARLRFNYHIAERNEKQWQDLKQIVWQRFLKETEKFPSKTEFTWCKELLMYRIDTPGAGSRFGIPDSGVAFIHSMATHGRLNEVPTNMLTWDVISLEEAQSGRTPIRHAAKYGWIEQIPPKVVAEHYETVLQIATQAVENSRSDGRARRRVETCRWLISVALARDIDEESRMAEARCRIEQMVDDAIRAGVSIYAPPIANSVTNNEGEGACAFLKRYLSNGNQSDLDISIFEFYLDRLITFAKSDSQEIRLEKTPDTHGRAFHKRLDKPRLKSFPQQTITFKQVKKQTEAQIDLI